MTRTVLVLTTVLTLAAAAAGWALGTPRSTGSVAPLPVEPRAWIDSPVDGTLIALGDVITVVSHATAPDGIAATHLTDDAGGSQTEPEPGTTLVTRVWSWVPPGLGVYELTVTGERPDGSMTRPTTITLLVGTSIDGVLVPPPASSAPEPLSTDGGATGASDAPTPPADDPSPASDNGPAPSRPGTPSSPPDAGASPSPDDAPTPEPSTSPSPSGSPSPSPSPQPSPEPTPPPSPDPDPDPDPDPTPTCTTAPTATSPRDGAYVEISTTLRWDRGSCVPDLWEVEIYDSGFDGPWREATVEATSDEYATGVLPGCDTFYWRVRGVIEPSGGGDLIAGPWSTIVSFTTTARGC